MRLLTFIHLTFGIICLTFFVKVYLDNAASTPVDSRVSEAMAPFVNNFYGNPSSIHSFGKQLKVVLEEAREIASAFIGCKPKEIFFTSGGTEANNSAIKGLTFACFDNLSSKNHIITNSIEHPAVTDTVNYMQKFGFEITVIKPEKNGRVDPELIKKALKPSTLLVTMMHANNELGTINDIEKTGEICRENGVWFHSDTVQSIGKTELNVKNAGLHFATCSAHKIYGPKGTGFLYVSEETKIDKYIHGGGQERNMRGGTENIAGIAGLMTAILILKNEMSADIRNYKSINKYLSGKLLEVYGSNVIFNSPADRCLDNILNISFNHEKLNVAEGMLPLQLDIKGVSVSGGSACASGSLKPSSVLLETGINTKTALSSIRVSSGRHTTKDEIDYFIKSVSEIVTK